MPLHFRRHLYTRTSSEFYHVHEHDDRSSFDFASTKDPYILHSILLRLCLRINLRVTPDAVSMADVGWCSWWQTLCWWHHPICFVRPVTAGFRSRFSHRRLCTAVRLLRTDGMREWWRSVTSSDSGGLYWHSKRNAAIIDSAKTNLMYAPTWSWLVHVSTPERLWKARCRHVGRQIRRSSCSISSISSH